VKIAVADDTTGAPLQDSGTPQSSGIGHDRVGRMPNFGGLPRREGDTTRPRYMAPTRARDGCADGNVQSRRRVDRDGMVIAGGGTTNGAGTGPGRLLTSMATTNAPIWGVGSDGERVDDWCGSQMCHLTPTLTMVHAIT